MNATTPPQDPLTEVRELNRLFLDYLRAQSAADQTGLGLPGEAGTVLRRIPEAALARLADYPQAMFRIDLGRIRDRDVREPQTVCALPSALVALHSMLLVSARHLARENPFAARLFLRLDADGVRELAALAVADLPTLAARAGIIRCAFGRLQWMWRELFREREPAEDRALILLGLQPNIELNPPISLRS